MKWASREAVDVYFKAKSMFQLGARTIRAGEPVLIFDSVKTSTLEVGAEISYVTGGRGNNRLLSFEGDKSLTFQFEDALLSNEGLAILAGADLIPARNKHLKGAAADATSVISHYTEKYSVATANIADASAKNIFPEDASIPGIPRGGINNVWFTKKPYVGQNASIYVMLLDDAGEMSGAPIQINLDNVSITDAEAASATVKTAADFATGTAKGATTPLAAGIYNVDGSLKKIVTAASATASAAVISVVDSKSSYLAKFTSGEFFVAFGNDGLPISLTDFPDPAAGTGTFLYTIEEANAQFDDMVEHYVTVDNNTTAPSWWLSSWGTFTDFVRTIAATSYGDHWGAAAYSYLLAPSGGIAQPKAFREGASFVYKCNVPSILYQDICLLDYYVEYQHDATQVSILPDKFGPFMYVEGSTLIRRASDGTDLPCEFVIPKFKITTQLSFTMQGTGDASTFTFQGDAYPEFSKFDLSRKVLADIQILDADDNYDGASNGSAADPTSYRRFQYNNDSEGEYIWKDPSMEAHANMDYSDIPLESGQYALDPDKGGPATLTPGSGNIDK